MTRAERPSVMLYGGAELTAMIDGFFLFVATLGVGVFILAHISEW